MAGSGGWPEAARAAVNDDELTALFAAFSYSDAMAGLYRDAGRPAEALAQLDRVISDTHIRSLSTTVI